MRYEAPRRSRCAPLRRRIRTSGRSRVSRARRPARSRTGGWRRPRSGPIAAPGKYTVKMTVDGQTHRSRSRSCARPTATATDADLQSSVRLQLKVRDDITLVSDMTNQIEWMRKQLEDQQKTRAGQGAAAPGHRGIDKKLQDVEYKLITRADALSDDKYFQTAYKLYQNFIWLNGEIGTGAGDVQGSGDWGPTETAVGLVLDLERQLQAVQAEYKSVMDEGRPGIQSGDRGQRTGAIADCRGRGGGNAHGVPKLELRFVVRGSPVSSRNRRHGKRSRREPVQARAFPYSASKRLHAFSACGSL